MNKIICVMLFALSSAACFAEKIQLKPSDCGPLARGDLGVIFTASKLGSDQIYFVKGKAIDICPKLMSATSISGFESDYCANHESKNMQECALIKIFTITEYQSVPEIDSGNHD